MNKKVNAQLAVRKLTEEELKAAEREAVAKLVEVLPVWSQQLGPGLDMVFAGIGLMLLEIDKVAVRMEGAETADIAIRTAALAILESRLAIPTLPNLRMHKAKRIKVLGGKLKALQQTAYDTRTIALLAEDFLGWYDEAGFTGFLGSLMGTLRIFDEVFHGFLDDESVARNAAFFLSAFEMRNRFGKIPSQLMGAIEILAERMPSEKTPA